VTWPVAMQCSNCRFRLSRPAWEEAVDALMTRLAERQHDGDAAVHEAVREFWSRVPTLHAAADATCGAYITIACILDRAVRIDAHLTLAIVRAVLHDAPPSDTTGPSEWSDAESLAWQTKAFVDAHCGERCRLRDVAAALRTSVRALTSAFQNAFGRSIHSYLTDMRLVRALRLMASTQHKLYTIAVDSGFGSISSLQRALRVVNPDQGRRRRHRVDAAALLMRLERQQRTFERRVAPQSVAKRDRG
jgi:AraC-like DNA-binding protein